MKPPLSDDYCSTINVADESVCEIPVNKVKRWIDNNDFKQNEDVLRSESFHSLATSQMFAYIHKHDKNKQASSALLGYIDNTQIDKQSESSIEMNAISNSLSALYIDEVHLNQTLQLTSIKSCQLNPYCEEHTVFNIPHSSQIHAPLPDYIEESDYHHSRDHKEGLRRSSSSISLDSFTSPLHQTRIPDKLNILKDGHTGSLPVLTPYVSNPIFAENFDLFSYSEITDSMNGNSDPDSHGQNRSTKDTIDSGVNTGSRSHDDSELDTSTTEAIETSGYYESPSCKNKEMSFEHTIHYHASDLSLCSNQSHSSVNASLSGIQTCYLGYIELPADKTKCMYFENEDSSKNSSLSELDSDIDGSHHCDTASTGKYTSVSPNVSLGYVSA